MQYITAPKHHKVINTLLLELQTRYGFRSFTLGQYRSLATWQLSTALQTNRGIALVRAAIEELRGRSVIVPRLPVLERLCAETALRAQRQLFATLCGRIGEWASWREVLGLRFGVGLARPQINRKRNMRVSNKPLAVNFLEAVSDAHGVIDFLPALHGPSNMVDTGDVGYVSSCGHVYIADLGL